MRASLLERSHDPRKCLSAVDEQLERIALPHRSGSGPTARGRLERVFPADPPQAPSVMSAHLHRQLIARPPIDESPAATRQRQPSQRPPSRPSQTRYPSRREQHACEERTGLLQPSPRSPDHTGNTVGHADSSTVVSATIFSTTRSSTGLSSCCCACACWVTSTRAACHVDQCPETSAHSERADT